MAIYSVMPKAWVVWINTDRTEGIGIIEPAHVCATRATAERLAKGADVQGCDALITGEDLSWVDGRPHGPVRIVQPTKEDTERQEELTRQADLKAAKKAARERALAAGVSEGDLDLLTGGVS